MEKQLKQGSRGWNLRFRRFNPERFALKWSWVLIRAILISGLCYVILYPLFFKLSIVFKSRIDIYDTTVLWIPRNFTLDSFRTAFEALNYPTTFASTIMISLITTLFQVISCSLAAFGFARLRFKGSGFLFACVIFTIVVPSQTIMIPTYLNYRYFDVMGLISLFTGERGINLLDTYWPFILQSATGMGIKSGLFIFIFRQFFRGLPKELEESAYIDGCGVPQTFFRIMLPNAVPAMITVLLFSFVWQWNDSYFVSLYLTRVKVLATQLPTMWASFQMDDPLYAFMIKNAGEMLFIAPVLILYLFVQRYFVESVERTGIVG